MPSMPRLIPSVFALLSLLGCVDVQENVATPSVSGGETAQPRLATYSCGDGTSLTVRNDRTEVSLTDPEGEMVVLPASPSSQNSRYGQGAYALVLDGSEALYVKGGREPLTCTR